MRESTLINGRGPTYVQPTEKLCRLCGEVKPMDDFHRRTSRPGGRISKCKVCIRRINFGRDRTSPGWVRTRESERRNNLRRYGITPEQFDHMLAQQGGVCAVCSGPAMGKGRYHVDHCHATGQVRGLLCHKCNVALGMVQDSPDHLRALIQYLGELT